MALPDTSDEEEEEPGNKRKGKSSNLTDMSSGAEVGFSWFKHVQTMYGLDVHFRNFRKVNHHVVWRQAYKTLCKFGESLLARSSKLQTTLAELEGEGDEQGDQVHPRITKPPI